jgi:hypothetical protein
MTEGPLIIILDMIMLVIQNVLGTLSSLMGMLGELLGSLFVVAGVGGTLGIFLAFIIIALVGFFLAKFFFGSVKTVLLLIVVGFLILVFILFGSGAV